MTPAHWSLAYFKAEGESITVYCPQGHGAEVDIDEAIRVFGPDFELVKERPRFLRKFVCKQCGQRAIELILSPSQLPYSHQFHPHGPSET